LLADESGIAESTERGMAGILCTGTLFPLLFFFQLKI
jgi:hypothetical protein